MTAYMWVAPSHEKISYHACTTMGIDQHSTTTKCGYDYSFRHPAGTCTILHGHAWPCATMCNPAWPHACGTHSRKIATTIYGLACQTTEAHMGGTCSKISLLLTTKALKPYKHMPVAPTYEK